MCYVKKNVYFCAGKIAPIRGVFSVLANCNKL